MELDVEKIDQFEATIHQSPLGSIGFSEIQLNAGQTLKRTSSAISRCNRQQFEFIVMQAGTTLLSQNNTETLIESGDSVLIDNRSPYRLLTTDCCRNLVFHIPVSWMQLWIPCPEEISALPIRGSTPWGQVLQSMCKAIQRAPGSANSPIYADQIAGAISLAHSESIEQKSNSKIDQLYEKAIHVLHESSHHIGFSPKDLAEILNISVRYTHKVFAAQGTTFSEKLQESRLNSAARMLSDSRFAQLPIAEICWRNGFCDNSHFSRCFSKFFGMPPGQFSVY